MEPSHTITPIGITLCFYAGDEARYSGVHDFAGGTRRDTSGPCYQVLSATGGIYPVSGGCGVWLYERQMYERYAAAQLIKVKPAKQNLGISTATVAANKIFTQGNLSL